MNDGITKSEIVDYFNSRVSYMAKHHDRPNCGGRHTKIKRNLTRFIKPGMKVLDLGCGIGAISKHMAELGAIVVAIDIAPALIEYAKKHLSHENITYMVQDISDLDLNEKFDAVVMADVFEHVERDNVFQCVWRILKYHTNENSWVYLNLPDYNFQNFLSEYYPDKQQIIDEAWKADDIISLFGNWQFVPVHMSIYGIDINTQYNEFVFIHTKTLNNYYREKLDLIYKGEGNGQKHS